METRDQGNSGRDQGPDLRRVGRGWSVIRLAEALRAWGTPDFDAALKREIEQLETGLLPLQQGLTSTSYVTDGARQVVILGATEDEDFIHVKAGIFYTGVIAGCSCADDPTPVEDQTEYCVTRLDIDKRTAETVVTLVEE